MQVLKLVFSLLLILYSTGCEDIPRDNPLDPGNPDSYRQQIIAIEAFVNSGSIYSAYAIRALDSLQQKYGDRITRADLHRNQPSGLQDPDHLDEVEFIYANYINSINNAVRGVPDIFINGTGMRIQGATTVANCYTRLEEAIQPYLVANSYLTLEPAVSKSGNVLELSLKLAGLGSGQNENLLVRVLLLENTGELNRENVVRKVIRSTLIPQLDAGDIKTVELTDLDVGSFTGDWSLVFQVLSEDELEIHQSIGVTDAE